MSGNNEEVRTDVAETLGLDGHGPRRKHRYIWLILAGVVGVGAWFAMRGGESETVEYVSAPVVSGPLFVTVTATGTLQPTNQIDVGSEVSGEVEEIFVDYNDHVTRGQIIAQLNTEQLDARLASTQASLAVAEASLTQARATAEEAQARAARSRRLADTNIASQQTLETDVASAKRAVASVASAEAQVTVARATLLEAQTSLRKAVIRSPIDGMVLSREIDPGQTLASAFQTPLLFKLAANLEQMELHLDIDESDIGLVSEGQHAKFRVDAFPGREFGAKITSVRFDPRTVNNIVTYESILAVENAQLLLRPGMTATADIVVAEKESVLLVPNRALRFLPPGSDRAQARAENGRNIVWVQRNAELQPVAVEIGLSNDEVTEIVGGDLVAGSEVVIDIDRPERQQQEEQQQGRSGPFG